MKRLAKTKALILDDLGLTTMNAFECRDLLEVIADRHGLSSTIVSVQLLVSAWHVNIKDPTIADTILDRLDHSAPKITLKVKSMRKRRFDL